MFSYSPSCISNLPLGSLKYRLVILLFLSCLNHITIPKYSLSAMLTSFLILVGECMVYALILGRKATGRSRAVAFNAVVVPILFQEPCQVRYPKDLANNTNGCLNCDWTYTLTNTDRTRSFTMCYRCGSKRATNSVPLCQPTIK